MRWLSYLNLALASSLAIVVSLFFFTTPGKIEFPTPIPRCQDPKLPKSPFALTEDYDLSEGPLALNWAPPLMQLPDLRNELQFYGQNERPDALKGKPSFHLGLKSSGEFKTVQAGQRIYLVYQSHYVPDLADRIPRVEHISSAYTPLWGEFPSTTNRGSYSFSPGNQPTPLWIETVINGNFSVKVAMLDEKGGFVKTPQELSKLVLQKQEFPKMMTWELDGHRVDSTLLVRQKARLIGLDRFLERHGGEEFAYAADKERIDFYAGETPYSCFAGIEDCLVWKNGRWNTVAPGEKTEDLPLLCVKKIDEKILSFELWDAQGHIRIPLSLIRMKDHQKNPDLAQEFKFVGAKTWAQFIVECRNGERMTLKANDWLVLTRDGWEKLDTAEQIDNYVEGQILGPLFVLDKMTKQNGRQVLMGHLFNTTRTEVEEIQLESTSHTALANLSRTLPPSPPIKPEGDDE